MVTNDSMYWVVSQSLLDSLDYRQLEDDSIELTRLSVDKTLAIIEARHTPTNLNVGDSMTHKQALSLMNTLDWYVPDPAIDV